MPRFYTPDTIFVESSLVELPKATVHHAMRVLRMRNGDIVELFDGKGNRCSGTITFTTGAATVAVERLFTPDEVKLKINLIQSLVANEKMDWIVEKACETGVSSITVFPPARCDIRLNEEKALKRVERWLKIAVSACEQCGRNSLPEISFLSGLKEATEQANGLKLILHPVPLGQNEALPEEADAVTFLIGPEGGFNEKEIALALEQGFRPRQLGKLVLRTETAGIAASSFAQTLWGDY